MINTGFVLAKKQSDGSMGRPVGNEDGAVMVFDDLEIARIVQKNMETSHGALSIFIANISFSGEVL